jgi:acetyl-CoA carboxylase carboxyltransferase component
VRARLAKIEQGGEAKYHAKASEEKKLFCRDRLRLLLDGDSFV